MTTATITSATTAGDPNSSTSRSMTYSEALRDAMARAMTEDDRDKGKEKVQDLLKQYEAKIDQAASAKEKEVMEG